MNDRSGRWFGLGLACVLLWAVACRQPGGGTATGVKLPPEVADLGRTVGDVGRLVASENVAVEGYGLVAGLPGTGATTCPPAVRDYLKRFVGAEVPDHPIDVDRLIASRSTAVVYIEGTLPPVTLRGDRFDIRLTEVTSDATVSLAGGWLYAAKLWLKGTRGASPRTLARVRGASSVFYDRVHPDPAKAGTAVVLGGGYALLPARTILNLGKPDYLMTSVIRDLTNGRFQPNTAVALSGGTLQLTIPPRYRLQRERFLQVVLAQYLEHDQLRLARRVATLVQALEDGQARAAVAARLEALGGPVQGPLGRLLDHPDPAVRLAAARCLVNLGRPQALRTLAALMESPTPEIRREAVRAVIGIGGNTDVRGVLLEALRRADEATAEMIFIEAAPILDGRWLAEGQRGTDIGGALRLHRFAESPHALVVASRALSARVGLFGPDLVCRPDTDLRALGGSVAIRVRGDRAQVLRRLPGRRDVIGPVVCSTHLEDVIRALCERPGEGGESGGCGLPYMDLLPLLQKMCEERVVEADFRVGPPSEWVQ